MRIFVMLLLVFISLSANDKNITLSNELVLLKYQNQIFRLYENVASVDTKNELLQAKVIENEKYYQKILEHQSKEFEIYLKQKQDSHNIIVDDLFYMFNVIVVLIVFSITVAGFGLNFFGKRMIKKLIDKQIKKDFNEEITSSQIERFKINSDFSKLIEDIIASLVVSDDDVVEDPL